MKSLLVALLVLGIFASVVFAQTAELKDRLKLFAGWLGIVRAAENEYKSTHRRYGDLSDLRKAHLLDAMVFESDSSADGHGKAEVNYVPKSTSFDVTVSSDGQHFRAVIVEGSVWLEANDMIGPRRWQGLPLDVDDGPEGPIICIAG